MSRLHLGETVDGRRAGPFGVRLRQWRRVRGLSQLDLATTAGSTARHVSFLETGRSRPGRDLVLRLAEALDLSLRDRNELLQAAGIAAVYPTGGWSVAQWEPVRRAVERLLAAHEPYPALVLDPHSTVLAANRACQRLFGRDLTGTNMIRLYLAEPTVRDVIVNWPQVARAALDRLRRQLRRTPFDDELRSLVRLAETAVADRISDRDDGDDEDQAVLGCPWFRAGDSIIRTVVMTGRFDAAADVEVDELRIELIYPQDDLADAFFRAAPRSPASAT